MAMLGVSFLHHIVIFDAQPVWRHIHDFPGLQQSYYMHWDPYLDCLVEK